MKNKRGEQTNSNSINKILIKQNYIKKLNILLREDPIIEKEVYNLIRNFFKEYLELNYEFTNEEIKKELKQVYFNNKLKEQIISLFNKLSKLEYFSKKLPQEQLKQILLEFESILNNIVIVNYQEKLSFFEKVKSKIYNFLLNKKQIKNKEKSTLSTQKIEKEKTKSLQKENLEETKKQTKTPVEIIQNIKPKIKPEPKETTPEPIEKNSISENQNPEKIIKQNLEKINNLIKTDYAQAKLLYFETLRLYNSSNDEIKNKYFLDIQKAYQKLKNYNN